MELLALYEAILKSLNFSISSEGLLSYCYDGDEIPAVIEGRRLVLPRREVLRAGLGDNLMAFHPLSENPLRGESPVLRKLKAVVNHRLAAVISDLLLQFAVLGVDTSRHKLLAPKAAEVLSAMSTVDEKFVDTLKKILAKQQSQGPDQLISIYLKRGGTFRGQKVSRLAVVSFPIMEQLEQQPDKIFGVKVRPTIDLAVLDGLMRYILPGCDDLETYSAASQSLTAPYFDSLMRAFANVANQLNTIVKLHWKTLQNAEDLLIDTGWIEHFHDLSIYDGAIPALNGNEGEHGTEEPAPAAALAPAPAAAMAKNLFQTPAKAADAAAPAPAKPASTGPFHVDNVSAVLRQVAGPFSAGITPPTTAPSSASDPNKFDRSVGSSNKGKDEYAEWVAKRNRNLYQQQQAAAQPQPTFGYGVQQPGYAHPAPPPQNLPAWLAPAPQQVPPGEYAGRVRGQPIPQPAMGFGFGAPTPAWQQPTYGYGAVRGGYGGGGYGYGGGAL